MALLKYTGTSEMIQVSGYGHFRPGDEKEVDDMTAQIFGDQRCVDEGFEVSGETSPALKAAVLSDEDLNQQGLDDVGR